MIKRDFYPLTIAAEKVGCAVDDLLYLGAQGTLGIYFLPAGLQLVSEKYADDELIEKQFIDAYEPLKLSRRSVELLQAGNSDALIRLDCEGSDTSRRIRRFAPDNEPKSPATYDLSVMFEDAAANAKKIRADYSDVKISDVTLVVKYDELVSIIENHAKPKTNVDLSETERNTMLKLIVGMAIDAYGYDPDSKKNPATGNNNGSIKAALERVGLSADEKTIIKYLKEAVDRYPDVKPRKS